MNSENNQDPLRRGTDPKPKSDPNTSMWKTFLHLEEANPLLFYGCVSILAATFLMVCAGVGMVVGHQAGKPDNGGVALVESQTGEDVNGSDAPEGSSVPVLAGIDPELNTEDPDGSGRERESEDQTDGTSNGRPEKENDSERGTDEPETEELPGNTNVENETDERETAEEVTAEAETDEEKTEPFGKPGSGDKPGTTERPGSGEEPTEGPNRPTQVPTSIPVEPAKPTSAPIVTDRPTSAPVQTPVPTSAPAVTPKPTQAPAITPKPTDVPVVAALPGKGTPGVSSVSSHGRLSVSGNHIVDQYGKPFQMVGVSTHGLAWFPGYVNYESFRTLRDEWGVNAVRLALYTTEYGGYCNGGDQASLKNLINTGVTCASNLGMYVIIDWHVLQDRDPNVYKEQSIAFFREMSAKYAGNPSVIYEICNEPNGGTSWASIRSYAVDVIAAIRANDPNAIIVVGTPNWSQFVDQAAADPLTGSNLMYALHFYAGTHGEELRNTMTSAIRSGLPVICTEFGICDASGNGGLNTANGDAWLSTMNQYGVSYFIWSLCNKAETASLINSSVGKTSGWSYSELSDSGKWYVDRLGTSANLGKTQPVPTAVPTSTPTPTVIPAPTKAPEPTKIPEPTKTPEPTKVPEPTKTPEPTAVPAIPATSSNTKLLLTEDTSWNDGTSDVSQYGFTLENLTDQKLTDWKVELIFDGPVTLDRSWNGTAKVDGNKIYITYGEDWSREITSRGTINFGLIVKDSTLRNYRVVKK